MSPKGVTILAALFLVSVAILPSLAYASNGQWVKYAGNPVLSPTLGSWDAAFTISPKVLYDGTTFRMWYVGGTGTSTAIGLATSTDGINWTKHNGPVLTPGPSGAWDSSSILLGSVAWNGSLFLMWYSGTNTASNSAGSVGVATSNDGVTWTEYSGNPILTPSSADQQYLASPDVVHVGAISDMWYTARSAPNPQPSATTILYAQSLNNVEWDKWPTAVFTASSDSKAWDSTAVYSPSVIFDGTNYELWYTGLDQSLLNPQIGLATSPDGSTWIRSSMNPVLSPGPAGSWDSAGVEQPSVVQSGSNSMLYYDGFSQNSGGRIGLAQGRGSIPVPEFPPATFTLLVGLTVFSALCLIRHKRQERS